MAAENNVENIAQILSAAFAPGSNIVSSDPSDYAKYWDERFKTDRKKATHDLMNILENPAAALKDKLKDMSKAQRDEAIKRIVETYDGLCEWTDRGS
ncbi:hypothetical protein Plec18167_006168 [Paecilomyces lecythidis]|uniref:Uncharacterized protein n=1 Tax=Paecilomyces lecythidis TaxID=3004212 RepID=A0ABR3XCG7_9EURO